jgi:hypothetical protein
MSDTKRTWCHECGDACGYNISADSHGEPEQTQCRTCDDFDLIERELVDAKAERDKFKALLAGTCNELQSFGCDAEEPGIYRDATVALGWT